MVALAGDLQEFAFCRSRAQRAHANSVLAYLFTRPPEFGGDIAVVRTVTIASIVNLGIVGVLLFDGRVVRFLGNAPLVGGWVPKR